MFPWLMLLACNTAPQWPEAAPADACAAGAIPAGEYVLRVEIDGTPRQALVWMPPGDGPHDVVVNLHEMNSEPRRQQHYSGWIDKAREIDAILVGPDGKAATWNAGECCGKGKQRNTADVAFLDALVARIDAVGCTSGRVLATGVGAGAMMAQRWACDSAVPDAVISVGGALQLEACAQATPIPMAHWHGTADTWMPLDGSGHHRPLSHTVAVWGARNRASPAGAETNGRTTCEVYAGAAPMRVCTVDGMADKWPGAEDARGVGSDATDDGWAFVAGAWDQIGATPR